MCSRHGSGCQRHGLERCATDAFPCKRQLSSTPSQHRPNPTAFPPLLPLSFDLPQFPCSSPPCVAQSPFQHPPAPIQLSPRLIQRVHRLKHTLRSSKKLFTLLDLCVSSLRRGHANLLCIVPILTDDPRRESSFARELFALSVNVWLFACEFSLLQFGYCSAVLVGSHVFHLGKVMLLCTLNGSMAAWSAVDCCKSCTPCGWVALTKQVVCSGTSR